MKKSATSSEVSNVKPIRDSSDFAKNFMSKPDGSFDMSEAGAYWVGLTPGGDSSFNIAFVEEFMAMKARLIQLNAMSSDTAFTTSFRNWYRKMFKS